MGPLNGVTLTLDALHTGTELAHEIIENSAGNYLFTVKNNQKMMRNKLAELFKTSLPSEPYITEDKNHGRFEKRTYQTINLVGRNLQFPYAKSAIKVIRERTAKNGKKKEKETTTTEVYLISSLPIEELTLEQAASLTRGHWSIENKLHHVKDASIMEDRSRIRNGAGRITSAIRTLITRIFSRSKRSYTQLARHLAGNIGQILSFINCNHLKARNFSFSG